MPTSPIVDINVVNQSTRPTVPLVGVHYVMGPTARGKFNAPEEIITSWTQFKRVYGGLLSTSDFPLLCRRALEGGANLRVSRIGHYTDITDASTLDPTASSKLTTGNLVFAGDFVSSNTIDMTVAGSAMPTVTFTTDHNTTLAAIATALEGMAEVASAKVADLASGNEYVIAINFSDKTSATEIGSITVAGGASQTTGTFRNDMVFINKAGEELFSIAPLAEGDGYNGLRVTLERISSNNTFSLKVQDPNDSSINESYQITLATSSYLVDNGTLAQINNSSTLITATKIADTPGDLTTGMGVVHNEYLGDTAAERWSFMAAGTPGGAITVSDYTGDSASKLGIHSFDEYDDGWLISAPELSHATMHIKGASYANARKDLIYVAHLGNSNNTTSTLVGAKEAITGLNEHVITVGGGLKILDPITSTIKEISEVTDLMALSSQVQNAKGPWIPFTGPNNGVIGNAVGVVNNFGSKASYDDLNILANSNIMMTILRNGQVMAWGGYTQDTTNSQLQWVATTMMVMYLRRVLGPTLEGFIDEPATIQTLRRIYETVSPTLEELLNKDAYTAYEWNGDQYAKSDSDLQINTPSLMQQGQLKIQFLIKPTGFVQEISVDIVVTEAGVDFETASALAS